MMLTKEQLKIFGAFKKDVFARLTFSQIKAKSRQKSNNTVQLALKAFRKENLVSAEKTGDVTAYALNLGNNLALSYLNLANELEIYANRTLPKNVLEEMKNRIFRHSEFFILLVFGSFAGGRATEKSDLDVAVIVENVETKKEITPYLETVKRRALVTVDYHVFTRKEFLEMLAIDQENVGKEIYRKNIAYHGLIEYYNLIRRLRNERLGRTL